MVLVNNQRIFILLSLFRRGGLAVFFFTSLLFGSFRSVAQCPTISSILVDACGTEQLNEFIIIHSGGGFLVDELFVDYDINNNILGPENNDIHTNNNNQPGPPCGLQPGNPAMISGCSNIIPVGLGTFIPANAYVVLQNSNGANIVYDFSAVCSALQQCVYLIQNSCTRSAGGFTNAGAGMRTTNLGLTSGCTNAYTYTQSLLIGGNGAYFIPPSTYGNGGCAAPPGSFGTIPITPALSGIPASLCQTDPPIALPTTQSGIMGNWSGMGVAGNMFNPSGLSGNITLTFSPSAGQCATSASTSIIVTLPIAPVLSGIPVAICQNSAPIALPTNLSGIIGNWSGMGVAGNMFDPAGLNGNILLTFTPNAGQCATTASTNITVTLPTTPMITGIPASICQNNIPIALPTTQSGITGNWSGMGVGGNMFNPSGLSGNITLTFTPTAGQCATTAATSIMVTIPVVPVISGVPASMCELDNPVALPTSLSGIAGNWSGLGVSGNTFNPSGLGGPVVVTFTPTVGQCASSVSTTITVNAPSIPIISGLPASMCQDDPAINLPTTLSGISGNWSGNGVSGNMFDPNGLSGNILLAFNPASGQCAVTATAVIAVVVPIEPPISGIPASLCQDDLPISLPTIQGGVSGEWSGMGVSGNTFDPSGLSGFMTLTFIPDPGQCAALTTISISVELAEEPILSGIPSSLCENGGVIVLPTTQGGITGDWSGPGVTGNTFDPNNQSGTFFLDFTPDPGQCALPTDFEISIHEPPFITSFTETCDLGTLMYTVSFTITGGSAGTYTVNGIPVGGSMFTSPPMPSGSTYLFEVDDQNGCGPVTLTQTVNCNCATSAGTMDFSNTPYLLCDSSGFTAVYAGNQMLDPDDLLFFILHTNPGTNPGTILATSGSSTFPYPAGIILGQTYYVSAVAGSDNGSGMIDFSDPCLSVTPGIPIVFYTPTFSITATPSICENECVTFQIDFTGQPPFSFDHIIRAGGNDFPQNWTGVGPSAFIAVCPQDYGVTNGPIELVPIQLSDFNCQATGSAPSPYVVAVQPVARHMILSALCVGMDTLINGVLYNESQPSGMDTLRGAATNGCDSIIEVDLTFLPDATLTITQTLCTGGSIIVNGTIYDETNPSGLELIPGGSSNGCDSIISIDLTFNNVVTFDLEPVICEDDTVYVNGTAYHFGQPTGMELFPGGSVLGCDSVVNIDLQFYPASIYVADFILCPEDSVIVNGTVYNFQNPNGTEILENASVTGCDSIIIVTVGYYAPDEFFINDVLCAEGSITVNGTIYHELNPFGTEVLTGGSVQGCDSIVHIDLAFITASFYFLDTTLTAGGSIVINGTVYDMANPQGIEVLPGGSYTGCDSTIQIELTFLDVFQGLVSFTSPLCAGDTTGTLMIDTLIGGSPPYTVEIIGAAPVVVVSFPVIWTGLNAGTYDILMMDATGTSVLQTIQIPDAPVLTLDLGPDQTVASGGSIALSSQSNFTIVQWDWSPPTYLDCTDCPAPIVVQPTSDILYTLTAYDAYGCAVQDQVRIRVLSVLKLYAPNIFSPDGDGVNDAFMLFANDEVVQINMMRIFNRWGSILYERGPLMPGDTDAGWDGTFHDKPMDPGVYVWWVEVTTTRGDKQSFSGDVTLLR